MNAATSDDARLRQESERVERLLEEVQSAAGPATWSKVQELVHRLVGLYGEGIARLLAHASASADQDHFKQKLAGDDWVSSLLVLHGLHPTPLEERIRGALETVRPQLGTHAGGVELLEVTRKGVVRLRLVGTCRGCPSSRATVEQLIHKAILAATPEVERVDVDGVTDEKESCGVIPAAAP